MRVTDIAVATAQPGKCSISGLAIILNRQAVFLLRLAHLSLTPGLNDETTTVVVLKWLGTMARRTATQTPPEAVKEERVSWLNTARISAGVETPPNRHLKTADAAWLEVARNHQHTRLCKPNPTPISEGSMQ